jgi:rfaE bifunctional protein kinase chain/domain
VTELKHELSDARIDALLAAFADVRALVVGDVFVDEYLVGDVQRVSPEAPVPVVHVHHESSVLGGAANVVRNIVALGAHCEICSVVGNDSAGDEVIDLLASLGVATEGVLRSDGRPTTRKTRVVARRQQIVRVDRETVESLPPGEAESFVAAVEAVLPAVQTVVLQDYAKGLLSEPVARSIMGRALQLGLPVSVDPKSELHLFRGASLVKPNLREAEAISGLSADGTGGLAAVARRLREQCGGGAVAITDGGRGITIFEGEEAGVEVPTVPTEVSDVQGAGDTIVGTLSIALRAGATLWEAAVLANAAASVVVKKSGTATATRAELREAIPSVRDVAEAAARIALRDAKGGSKVSPKGTGERV